MEPTVGIEHSVDLEEADEEAMAREAAARARHGFLPIVTNWFDRLFIGIYLFVALELLWMRFLEQSIPLWICHILALVLGVLIIWKG
jgi:predicted small integral membrane protein